MSRSIVGIFGAGLPAALALLLASAAGPCLAVDEAENRFDVVARGLEFDAPAETRPGWTRMRLINESGMTHFALVERLPEGIGLRQQQEQVAPVFQAGMDRLARGDAEAANAAFAQLPAWFGDVVFLGGPGLSGPGGVSEVTLYLAPGNYLLECYVKTGGTFHSYNPDPGRDGMVRAFRVAGEELPTQPPSSNLAISISSAGGFDIRGEPVVGSNTVRVRFADQKIYPNFVEHDLHLVRLDASTDLQQLEAWMDWTRVGGLETPAPARFVGGLNEMPAGSEAYLHLDLEPGRYAWIAEVPGAAALGMLQVFELR